MQKIVVGDRPAEAEAAVALRLQDTLRVVREDEATLKRIIEMRRLRRRLRAFRPRPS